MNKKTNQHLIDFLMSFTHLKDAANALGISKSTVTLWIKGSRKPSLLHCYKIEKLTKGKYKAFDLRPDFFKDE